VLPLQPVHQDAGTYPRLSFGSFCSEVSSYSSALVCDPSFPERARLHALQVTKSMQNLMKSMDHQI
jgi:hypothetical protein